MQTQKRFVSWVMCGSLVPSPQSKCPKRTFMVPRKYHASILNMLSKPLKCFRDQSWCRLPSKVPGHGLYFTPEVSCSKLLPKILPYFSNLKMKKTNNNNADYHLVFRRVISTPSDVSPV